MVDTPKNLEIQNNMVKATAKDSAQQESQLETLLRDSGLRPTRQRLSLAPANFFFRQSAFFG